MKIASCEISGKEQQAYRFLAGVVTTDCFIDLCVAHRALTGNDNHSTIPSSIVEFLEDGEQMLMWAQSALTYGRENLNEESPEESITTDGNRLAYHLDEITLLPAVPRPGKIIHTSVNFSAHKKEVTAFESSPEWQGQNWGGFHYQHPTGFLQAPSATVGSHSPVVIPQFTKQLDYEIEIATIIGKRASNVTEADALDYVAGYCIFNDMSARDIQGREHANKVIMLGKSFDTSCPLGPWLTTKEEISDPQNLKMELRLNGELRQDANTSEMIYSIPKLVSWWSQITLEPGDVITSGSPSGVIAAMPDPVWLASGDRIEASIEGLDTLVNEIVSSQ